MSSSRRFLVLALTLTVWACPSRARAQQGPTEVENFGGIEANALPAPTTPGSFASLQPAEPTQGGSVVGGARLSYLHRPVALTLPSPSPQGTVSHAVDGLLLLQAMMSAGLGNGFDAGLAFSLHAYQWGAGYSAATTGQDLEHFALGDPRLTLGWGGHIGPLSVRPHLTVFFPAGNEKAFASESATRAEVGVAFDFRPKRFILAADIAFKAREISTFGQTRWGPQLRAGLGGAFEFVETWSAGIEMQLMPTLYSQPEPLLAEPGYLFPAEAIASLRHRRGQWNIQAGLGTGVPLSTPSTVSADTSLQRGVTSPVVRAFFESRFSF